MKTICIYHSRDLDGWMSAAIVKKWFIEKNDDRIIFNLDTKEHEEHTMNPDKAESLSLLGWDYGDDIPDLSGYDSIIMCDVSFDSKDMYEISHSKEIIWIDHHMPKVNDVIEFFRDKYCTIPNGSLHGEYAACELTWMYFFPKEPIPEIVRLLGRYDCFGHKGTHEEEVVLEFQYASRGFITNYEDAYKYLTLINDTYINEFLRVGTGIYKYLKTEAKQTYAKAFPVEFVEPNVSIKKGFDVFETRNFLVVNQERFNPINFGIDYHKDGYDGFGCFWLKNGKWTWSLYNDNGEVNCAAICKSFGGGGHKSASGFVCDTDTLIKIIGK